MKGTPQTSYVQATLANALRVFQAGAGRGPTGLKAAGAVIGTRWREAIQRSISIPGSSGSMGVSGLSTQIPSSPGSPPHMQSGALRDSIKFRTARLAGQQMGTGKFMRSGRVVIDIYSDPYQEGEDGEVVNYAALHEFGGVRNGRRYPPRPFFRPVSRNPAMKTMIRITTRNFFLAEEWKAAMTLAAMPIHMVPIIISSARSIRPMKFN